MKKLLYLVAFVCIVVFSVKSWRDAAIAKIMGYEENKRIVLPQKSSAKPIKTYSSENLKVSVYSISEFTPTMDVFKMKDPDMHYVLLETSIENLSDSILDAGWFNSTYFVEDDKGHLVHCYMDELTGYYQEKNIQADSSNESYYGKKLPARTALSRKYFFFPMYNKTRPVKVHFDDPLAKTRHEFPL